MSDGGPTRKSGDYDVLQLILGHIGELREDQQVTTHAVQQFGVRLTAVEERIIGQHAVVTQRMKKQSERMERFAGRMREIGGKVDGQEITQQTSIAALEAERRMIEMAQKRRVFIAKVAMWAAGTVIAISTAIISWVFFK